MEKAAVIILGACTVFDGMTIHRMTVTPRVKGSTVSALVHSSDWHRMVGGNIQMYPAIPRDVVIDCMP